MKYQTQRKPTPTKLSLLRQLRPLIPNHLVPQLTRTHAVAARSRKAAAKCHVRLNLQTFLPRFALVDTAGEHPRE